jgi:hypothetical protein
MKNSLKKINERLKNLKIDIKINSHRQRMKLQKTCRHDKGGEYVMDDMFYLCYACDSVTR